MTESVCSAPPPQAVQWHRPETANTATPARWSGQAVMDLLTQPFNDLLWQAQQVHRAHFDPNVIERATLLSIKTGGCPEDCAYCPQSVHYGVD